MLNSSEKAHGSPLATMEPTFEKLLVLLAEGRVDFVLVGGVAVTLHGYMRLTEDVDIIVDAAPDNLTRLLQALSTYGQGFAAELSLEDFADEEGAIRIVEETESNQIDIFTRMSGLYYKDFVTDADTLQLSDHEIHFASKAALIHLKGQSSREKDILDVAALKKLMDNPNAFD